MVCARSDTAASFPVQETTTLSLPGAVAEEMSSDTLPKDHLVWGFVSKWRTILFKNTHLVQFQL